MCKVMIISGIKPEKQKALKSFVEAAVNPMTYSDFDGFGYMALADGKLFGERWLDTEQAFKNRQRYSGGFKAMLNRFANAVQLSPKYSSFGNVRPSLKGVSAIALHARMSTNSINMANTHPFVIGDTALIHNGVVDSTNLFLPTSTCDSEGILTSYIEHNVSVNPENIQKVADMLDGYYACGVFTKDDSDTYVLDIFKDSSASLYCVEVPALGAFVFCTAPDIVAKTASACNMKLGVVAKFSDCTFLRLDPLTGRRIGKVVNFKKFKVTKHNSYPSESKSISFQSLRGDMVSTNVDYDRWADIDGPTDEELRDSYDFMQNVRRKA